MPLALVGGGDEHFRGLLRDALGGDGLQVVLARDSDETLAAMADAPPDIAIIDTALEPVDGIELCLRWRSHGIDVPIVFVSSHTEVETRIDALLAGGDAFLMHPVHVKELVARVRRILWRTTIAADRSGRVADLTIDEDRGAVVHHGRTIDLSTTEFRLLHYLLVNRGHIVTRAQILQTIWGSERCSPKVVDVYIGYLRRKLPSSVSIRSVRSVGYVLEPTSR